MSSLHLQTFLLLGGAHAAASRRFDAHLGSRHGLGLNEFTALLHLYETSDRRLRRIDLADKLHLTPSGVTWLLRPLEKRGIVRRESNPDDARVAYATLTAAGERLVKDALATADELAAELLGPRMAKREVTQAVQLLRQLTV
jgi:DNA-binding MarR family transcriptional regulator